MRISSVHLARNEEGISAHMVCFFADGDVLLRGHPSIDGHFERRFWPDSAAHAEPYMSALGVRDNGLRDPGGLRAGHNCCGCVVHWEAHHVGLAAAGCHGDFPNHAAPAPVQAARHQGGLHLIVACCTHLCETWASVFM